MFGDSEHLREVTAKGGEHESQELADDEAEMLSPVAIRMLWPQVTETPNRSGLNNEPVLLPHITRCPEVRQLQGWFNSAWLDDIVRESDLSSCSAISREWTSISGLRPHGHKMATRVPDIPQDHYDIKQKKKDYFFSPRCLCLSARKPFLKAPTFPPLTFHISLSDTDTPKQITGKRI